MNQPELYPNFGYGIPNFYKGKDSIPPELPPTSSDEYDDSRDPPIMPLPLPKQYNMKPSTFNPPPTPQNYDKNYQKPPSNQYNTKSPRYLPPLPQLPPSPQPLPQLPPPPQPLPPPPPQPQTYDKSISYIAYIPVQIYNKTSKSLSRPTAPIITTTTTKRPYPVPPPFAYNKNTVPKYKIPPLQAYNKATFLSTPTIPPTVSNKVQQQQYASCICVPYYLCKSGVINSGGRYQAIQRRTARSLKFGFF
ncbi:uncharacterized protein CEXT_178641 [Caerostris extrusa]|uniref:PPAF-2-like Clip domain-containing protein n=1 Tax=Caerostris extrusa TaxID=172846 RepID=A0AAV4WMB7_CAEEX|nr:uncharacterized protein CEXT_178641 [Caerostris extrusa]